ncbi:glutamine--fructose-6-phosphate transaminase (isomerizing), partial [bacterium]|nr:glutamine--fructose-6-phosphate transaminase (isomerizing) [bacterium]MCI0605731.1 glutamine--fructose-6-phosphate transaminase (isomerizing) [bacterium]
MCGIVGYIGQKEVVPVLVNTLRKLEYRGYDSAGIAVVNGDGVSVRRSAGKLSNLESAIAAEPIEGYYGIGHTRWATHGRPTEENAHPHRDCTGQLVVVHNGIIENYLELKGQLQQEGHKFVTETDTEIIAHLLEKHYNGSLESAVKKAFSEIRGIYACGILSSREPNKIVGVRSGPPLVVGLGQQEYFLASDTPAILSHTRDVLFLDNQEMVVMTKEGVQLFNLQGEPVTRAAQNITWDANLAEKGDYPHYMLKEIFEQPWAIRETIVDRFSLNSGRVYLEEFEITEEQLAKVEKINFVAAGTSWHAALVGKFLLEELSRVPVEVDISSEFRYRNPVVKP